MRINIVINDQTIMDDILCVIEDMENDEEITFKDDQERQAFADECFDDIASKTECYSDYYPTWENICSTVHSMADQR